MINKQGRTKRGVYINLQEQIEGYGEGQEKDNEKGEGQGE